MAVRFPEAGSILSRPGNSRQTNRHAARTRPGRLLCFETEAFSVLSNESRHIVKLPWRKHPDLTGMAADICVLFTANDAYMRDLHLIVPPDCVASEQAEQNRLVLKLMQRVLKAEIKPSRKIQFNPKPKLRRGAHAPA
jgi:hypothetical protein